MLALALTLLLITQAPSSAPPSPPPAPTLPWAYVEGAEGLSRDIKGQQIRMCPPVREGDEAEMALILLLENKERKFLYWGVGNRWVIGEFPTVEQGAAPSRLWMGTVDPDTKAILIVRGPEPFSKDTHAGQPCAWLTLPSP